MRYFHIAVLAGSFALCSLALRAADLQVLISYAGKTTVGPLRLLVPGDKRPARWAHMVTSFEVVPVESSAGPQ